MNTDRKSRPPAFQLYADDFLSGTSDMTAEEVGGYIRLLCHQWTKGGIPNDEERAGRMAGLMGSPCLRYVLAKFDKCADGLLRNTKLEKVRAEKADFIARQSQNGKKGAEKRWSHEDTNGTAMATPLAPALATVLPKDSSPVSSLQSPITTPIAPKPKPAPSSPDVDGFDEFWRAYPKRTGKPHAIKAWNKLRPSPELKVAILQAIQAARRCDQWTKDNGQFIPHPATYLNGRRWEDEVEPLQPTSKDWRQMTPEEIIRESVG